MLQNSASDAAEERGGCQKAKKKPLLVGQAAVSLKWPLVSLQGSFLVLSACII